MRATPRTKGRLKFIPRRPPRLPPEPPARRAKGSSPSKGERGLRSSRLSSRGRSSRGASSSSTGRNSVKSSRFLKASAPGRFVSPRSFLSFMKSMTVRHRASMSWLTPSTRSRRSSRGLPSSARSSSRRSSFSSDRAFSFFSSSESRGSRPQRGSLSDMRSFTPVVFCNVSRIVPERAFSQGAGGVRFLFEKGRMFCKRLFIPSVR